MQTSTSLPARNPDVRWDRPPIPDTLKHRIIAHALRGDTKYRIAQLLGTNRTAVKRTIDAALSFALEPAAA